MIQSVRRPWTLCRWHAHDVRGWQGRMSVTYIYYSRTEDCAQYTRTYDIWKTPWRATKLTTALSEARQRLIKFKERLQNTSNSGEPTVRISVIRFELSLCAIANRVFVGWKFDLGSDYPIGKVGMFRDPRGSGGPKEPHSPHGLVVIKLT